MSHELRTPLNAILGYTQLLLDQNQLDPKQLDWVKTIGRSGSHLMSLINDVLDMSRIEAGRLELEYEPTHLPALIQEVADLCRPAASEKRVALTSENAGDLPRWIEADGRRLRQILLNLLGNAVKFTASGAVHLVATTDGPGRLRVTVRDTGPGIPADRLSTIFAPFEQTGDQKQRAKGTGLGLPIARQIARKMGGDIEVSSVFGEGSSFSLHLPFTACERPEEISHDAIPVTADSLPSRPPSQILPDAAVLASMHELAMQGDLSSVSKLATELADDEIVRPFAKRILELTAAFDDLAIEDLLTEALQQARAPEGEA